MLHNCSWTDQCKTNDVRVFSSFLAAQLWWLLQPLFECQWGFYFRGKKKFCKLKNSINKCQDILVTKGVQRFRNVAVFLFGIPGAPTMNFKSRSGNWVSADCIPTTNQRQSRFNNGTDPIRTVVYSACCYRLLMRILNIQSLNSKGANLEIFTIIMRMFANCYLPLFILFWCWLTEIIELTIV